MRSPPAWPTHALTVVACSLIVWGARIPRGDLPFLLAGLIVGAVVILNWLVKVLTLSASMLLGSRRSGSARVHWARWSIVPLSFTILSLVVWFGVPFGLSFRISRPALQRATAEIAGDDVSQRRAWIGVYPIAGIRSIPGGLEFRIAIKDFPWGQRGFYYSDTGARLENAYYYAQKRMDDSWFYWEYGGW